MWRLGDGRLSLAVVNIDLHLHYWNGNEIVKESEAAVPVLVNLLAESLGQCLLIGNRGVKLCDMASDFGHQAVIVRLDGGSAERRVGGTVEVHITFNCPCNG